MRLNNNEVQAIKSSIYKKDPDAGIILFGSRVDDQKRGGDIDLLIFSSILNDRDKRDIKNDLYWLIGEQKIDIIIAKDKKKAIVRIALENGIPL